MKELQKAQETNNQLKRRLELAAGVINSKEDTIKRLKNQQTSQGHHSYAMIACLGSYLDKEAQAEKNQLLRQIANLKKENLHKEIYIQELEQSTQVLLQELHNVQQRRQNTRRQLNFDTDSETETEIEDNQEQATF